MKDSYAKRIKRLSRESVERTLEWLQLREAGMSWAKIAARYGVTAAAVQQAVGAVLSDNSGVSA